MMKKVSRRQFIQQSAQWAMVSLALGAGGAAIGCKQTSPALKVIDVHVHADFRDEVLRRQARTLSSIDYSQQGLMAEMMENRVEHAITIGFETERDELSHQAENPMGLSAAGEPAGPLRNVSLIGGVNPHRLDQEGLTRIEQALKERRLKGLKIYLGYYHKHPDDDVYKPVYELAGQYQVPVVFHTGDTYSANAKVRYAHPLRIDDVAVDFRQVTFVLAHLGNPWTMDAAELLYKNPNVYADLSGFLVGDQAYFDDPENAEGFEHVIERIQRAVAWVENPKKFMYGSDWPLVPMKPYLALMKRAIALPHHERVFYANAEDVFKL